MSDSPLSIFIRFCRIGLMGFGGPFAQIGTLQRELVDQEKWTTHARFNRALAVYQVLPGPEALEMCCWLGAVRAGRPGALAAGLGFALPGVLMVLGVAYLYVTQGLSPTMAAAMAGAQAAALALIVLAVRQLGARALHDSTAWFLMLASLYCSLVGLPFWMLLPMAALCGYLIDRGHNWLGFGLVGALAFFATWQLLVKVLSPVQEDVILTGTGAAAGRAELIPVFWTGLAAGGLSFGGAYTAIPVLRDVAVVKADWLTNAQLLDGLAVVNCLPTPLVSIAAFVGFIATGGWAGGVVMMVGILLPAFAFTVVGHEHLEKAIAHEPLHATLDGVTASVIGVIAAAAMLMIRPTLMTETGAPVWPKVLIFFAALAVLLTVKWRYLAPAVMVGAAAVGAALLR